MADDKTVVPLRGQGEAGLVGKSGSGGSGGGSGFSSGGGGGGGNFVDHAFLEARIDAVKAQNETAFARLEAKIDGIKPGASWQQISGIVFVAVTGAFAILAYASDRFDSGVSAMGAIEERLDVQREMNESQNERIDRLLGALEQINDQPQISPPEGQN